MGIKGYIGASDSLSSKFRLDFFNGTSPPLRAKFTRSWAPDLGVIVHPVRIPANPGTGGNRDLAAEKSGAESNTVD
jgi:hypothetical protein